MGLESPLYVIMHELNISSLQKIHGKCVFFLRFEQCLNMIQRKWQHLLYTQSNFYSFCILSESLK